MEELLRRHAGEFDEAFHLIHSVDLIKNGTTYRIEILQKVAVGYRKQFVARYFKKSCARSEPPAGPRDNASSGSFSTMIDSPILWVSIPGVEAVADSARDTLNQALIWLAIYTKRQAPQALADGA